MATMTMTRMMTGSLVNPVVPDKAVPAMAHRPWEGLVSVLIRMSPAKVRRLWVVLTVARDRIARAATPRLWENLVEIQDSKWMDKMVSLSNRLRDNLISR